MASIIRKPTWLHGQSVGLAAVTLPFIMLLIVGSLASLSDRSGTNSPASGQVAAASATDHTSPNAEATKPLCLDATRKLAGRMLYNECAQTRIQIAAALKDVTSQSDAEDLTLTAALAEHNEAEGAYEVGMPYKKLFDESVAVFGALETSAHDARARNYAKEYYDCYALSHCPK